MAEVVTRIEAIDRGLDAAEVARDESVERGMRWQGVGQAAVRLGQHADDDRIAALASERADLVARLQQLVAGTSRGAGAPVGGRRARP